MFIKPSGRIPRRNRKVKGRCLYGTIILDPSGVNLWKSIALFSLVCVRQRCSSSGCASLRLRFSLLDNFAGLVVALAGNLLGLVLWFLLGLVADHWQGWHESGGRQASK